LFIKAVQAALKSWHYSRAPAPAVKRLRDARFARAAEMRPGAQDKPFSCAV
jgi:hypothetical protein